MAGLGAPDGFGDGVDATDELVLGEVAEGEEQCWLGRRVREPVATQTGDADPQGACRLHDSVLVDLEGEQEHGVATGGQSLEAVRTEDRGHLLGQGVAAGAGEGAHPPQGAGGPPPPDPPGPRPLRGCGSTRPDSTSRASASWSSPGAPRLLNCFSSVRTSTKRGGARTQPIRIAGAIVLLTEPRANTRSGSSP